MIFHVFLYHCFLKILFLSQKHIRAHKISDFLNIKNQQSTLIFIDPNEGIFEFSF